MDLRLGKYAVIFKDTFCLSKKKCTNGQNIHDALVYRHDSKYCSALIVLAEIASAKVIIFVLALAIASATRN